LATRDNALGVYYYSHGWYSLGNNKTGCNYNPGTTICDWINEVGVNNLTRDHVAYVYYKYKNWSTIAQAKYNELNPLPSEIDESLATKDNALGIYAYSHGMYIIGNMKTGCNYHFPEYGVKYHVTVEHVVDGDTFDAVFPNKSIERVRLLGVDTPETTEGKNNPNEYDDITNLTYLTNWGIKAENFTKSWLEGKDVYIEFDKTAGFKESYISRRWLAYVYLQNGTDFDAKLLEKGYARAYTEGTFSKENDYALFQHQAMENRTGLWTCLPEHGKGQITIVRVHYYEAAGNDGYNLNDEYVVIENDGNTSVDLTGYTLNDEANHIYTFPDGFVLNSSATVTVYTGSGIDTGTELYWGRGSPIWNNDHDTAYLRDNGGNLVDEWSW